MFLSSTHCLVSLFWFLQQTNILTNVATILKPLGSSRRHVRHVFSWSHFIVVLLGGTQIIRYFFFLDITSVHCQLSILYESEMKTPCRVRNRKLIINSLFVGFSFLPYIKTRYLTRMLKKRKKTFAILNEEKKKFLKFIHYKLYTNK